MTSVKQCARASYVEIYWFLSVSTTDVTTCDATDAFCALVWPQPKSCSKTCTYTTDVYIGPLISNWII
jgi:hypothetical protein